MSKNRWTIRLAMMVMAAAAASSRADLAAPTSTAVSPSSAAPLLSASLDHRSVTLGWMDEKDRTVASVCGSFPQETLPTASAKDLSVRQIPDMPGSATLFLYMASGLGIYQLGRSVRSLNFNNLPDWYQAGGVRQVGYAKAVDVSQSVLAMPMILAAFDEPMPEPSFVRSFREESPRFSPQYFLSEKDVRGPPCLS